jgi:hypothetical protein
MLVLPREIGSDVASVKLLFHGSVEQLVVLLGEPSSRVIAVRR